jgi:hypothetical protein
MGVRTRLAPAAHFMRATGILGAGIKTVLASSSRKVRRQKQRLFWHQAASGPCRRIEPRGRGSAWMDIMLSPASTALCLGATGTHPMGIRSQMADSSRGVRRQRHSFTGHQIQPGLHHRICFVWARGRSTSAMGSGFDWPLPRIGWEPLAPQIWISSLMMWPATPVWFGGRGTRRMGITAAMAPVVELSRAAEASCIWASNMLWPLPRVGRESSAFHT